MMKNVFILQTYLRFPIKLLRELDVFLGAMMFSEIRK